MKRVFISIEQLRILLRINAFRFTGKPKQQLLWDAHSVLGTEKKTNAKKELFEIEHRHFDLPELYYNKIDDAWDEIEILGFSLCSPFELLKENFHREDAKTQSELSDKSFLAPQRLSGELFLNESRELRNHLGKIISIVGYSVTRKRTRTKRGEEMSFGTFLDKEGKWIDTTHFPNVLKQFPFTGRGCYLITGKVVEEFGFFSIDVTEMKRLDYVERFSTEKKLQANQLAN